MPPSTGSNTSGTSTIDPTTGLKLFFGPGATSQGAQEFTPSFLANSQAPGFSGALLEGLFGPETKFARQKLVNSDLANIQASSQDRARQLRGRSRFRGSAVGEALGQGILQGGQIDQSRRRAQADQEFLRGDLQLIEAINSSSIAPILELLGLGVQQREAGSEAQLQRDLQPSTLDKLMGAVGGFFGGLCWVARAVLGAEGDQWLAARAYLLMDAPISLVAAYWQEGPALARRVEADLTLRAELTPVFTAMAEKGRKYLEA